MKDLIENEYMSKLINFAIETKGLSYFLLIVIACYFSYNLAKKYVLPIIERIVNNTGIEWDNVLYENGVFHKLLRLAPLPAVYFGAFLYNGSMTDIIHRCIILYIIINVIILIDRVLNSVLSIYNRFEISKKKPIKNFIQVVKFFVFFVAFLSILSVLFDKSITVFVSGLGALTAVLMLIFKEPILSFKAGLQLISNDMLRIDDWLEMPQHRVDGDVIDISLNTITVRNWDKTITYVPTFKLMEDSFKNWRGMAETGGRRISRSVFIDQHSVRFLNSSDIEELKKFDLIKGYLSDKLDDLNNYNSDKNWDYDNVNSRKLTNIGTFRAYLLNYLKSNPNIHQDLSIMVRQLAPSSEGIPIQIYAFTNDIRWEYYEGIQSDIFDHVLSIAPIFGLKIYQKFSDIKLEK